MEVKEKQVDSISSNGATLIKLPVNSFRRIANPLDETGSKMYIAVVNVKDVPEIFDEWRSLNVRDPRIKSGVATRIFTTLEDNPDSFFYRNRGITLIVERAQFDNQTNWLELVLSNKDRHGLLDGGHTFKVIRNFVEALDQKQLEETNAYVRIEVLEGINELEDVVSIVEARNTSTQVKDQSTDELRKHYEAIKEVLKDKPYSGQIAYKEYELQDDGSEKHLDIKDILSYLVCFDVENFSSDKHPISTYSTKSAVVRYFRENKERLHKYIKLLPDILELRDVIYAELPEAYNSTGGKFGGLKGVTEVTKKPRMNKEHLPYTGIKTSYRIPSGFIYPILASLRNLVDQNTFGWKKEPIEFFKQLKQDLAKRVCAQAIEFRNPNKMGKDNATWSLCYDLVELEVLKRGL